MKDSTKVVMCIGFGVKLMSGHQDTWCGGSAKLQFDSIEQAINSNNTRLCKKCVLAIESKLNNF